jgi:hypothetical protein
MSDLDNLPDSIKEQILLRGLEGMKTYTGVRFSTHPQYTVIESTPVKDVDMEYLTEKLYSALGIPADWLPEPAEPRAEMIWTADSIHKTQLPAEKEN